MRVTDSGTPALDDFEMILVTVNEVNLAPVLEAIGDQAVDEGTTLKRIMPRAKGRADRIAKRTCHITVKVAGR